MRFRMNTVFQGMLWLLMLGLWFPVAGTPKSSEQDTVITGNIMAVDWGEDDSVITVVISVTITPDDTTEEEIEEDYFVADTPKGRELLKLVDASVRVTGRIELNEEGYKTILVSDYTVVKANTWEAEEE